jgi:type IV secretion system protein TrbL
MFIGFFAALLQFSAEWASAIISSFQQAANIAGGTNLLRPSDIFDVGIKLATALYDASSNWNIVHNLVLVIAGFFILIAFGLITAYLIVALVESFIVISAGVLFMGFGGSRWTKDYAVRIFQYCMSIGAKLFVIQLLAGLTIAVVEPWAALAQGTSSLSAASLTSIFVLVGISIIFVAIISIIPQMVQTLINGSGVASGGERLYATTAGVVTGSVAGTVGGAMATHSARRLASEQLAAAEADGRAEAMKEADSSELGVGWCFRARTPERPTLRVGAPESRAARS